MNARKLPTDKELEEVARQHLSWEATCLLDILDQQRKNRIIHRNIIELMDYKRGYRRSFNHPIGAHDVTLHTRIIASFLKCPSQCRDGRHKNDVEAGHYITNWQGLDTLKSQDNWDFLNKSVSHLSVSRLSMGMSVPDREQLGRETLTGLKSFIDQVPDGKKDWFSDIKAALESAGL